MGRGHSARGPGTQPQWAGGTAPVGRGHSARGAQGRSPEVGAQGRGPRRGSGGAAPGRGLGAQPPAGAWGRSPRQGPGDGAPGGGLGAQPPAGTQGRSPRREPRDAAPGGNPGTQPPAGTQGRSPRGGGLGAEPPGPGAQCRWGPGACPRVREGAGWGNLAAVRPSPGSRGVGVSLVAVRLLPPGQPRIRRSLAARRVVWRRQAVRDWERSGSVFGGPVWVRMRRAPWPVPWDSSQRTRPAGRPARSQS